MTKTPRVKRGQESRDRRHEFHGASPERMSIVRMEGRESFDPQVPPSQEAIRRSIDAQMCPFCPKGPFAMVAVHTNKEHGVDKWQLRDMAGLTTNDPLCSEEVSQKMREKALQNGAGQAAAAAAGRGKGTRKKYRYTKAGIERVTANVTTWWESLTPEERTAEMRRRAESVDWGAVIRKRRKRVTPLPDHGTTARYRRGCKCAHCKAAIAAYQRSLTAKRNQR